MSLRLEEPCLCSVTYYDGEYREREDVYKRQPVPHAVEQGDPPQGPQIGLHGALPSVAKATRLPYGSRKNG